MTVPAKWRALNYFGGLAVLLLSDYYYFKVIGICIMLWEVLAVNIDLRRVQKKPKKKAVK